MSCGNLKNGILSSLAYSSGVIAIEVDDETFEHDINSLEKIIQPIFSRVDWSDKVFLKENIISALECSKEDDLSMVNVRKAMEEIDDILSDPLISNVEKQDEILTSLLLSIHKQPVTKQMLDEKLKQFEKEIRPSLVIGASVVTISQQKVVFERLFQGTTIEWNKYWKKYDSLIPKGKSSILYFDALEKSFLEE